MESFYVYTHSMEASGFKTVDVFPSCTRRQYHTNTVHVVFNV